MRIDEAWDDDAVAGVEHVGVRRRLQIATDARDCLTLDQHVGIRKIAERRIERQYVSAFDQNAAPDGESSTNHGDRLYTIR